MKLLNQSGGYELAFKSSALFPHGVFTVSAPDSSNNHSISPSSINRMFFFVMEDLSIDCEVGNEFLNRRLIVVKVPLDYNNSLPLSWPRLPRPSGAVPACTGFLCHKAGCRVHEMMKETSCSLRTTVRFWCLLRIFTFLLWGGIVRTWELWRAQYERYETDFWKLCCLDEKNLNVSKVHLQIHVESHSVNKCCGDMNVKLESLTKCSNFSCERSSTSKDPF